MRQYLIAGIIVVVLAGVYVFPHRKAPILGAVRYDYPQELTGYGVPGCTVWDMESPEHSGPVYYDHLYKTDYIIFKAPHGHKLAWDCMGYEKRPKGTKVQFPHQVPGKPDQNIWEQVERRGEGITD